VVAVPAKIMRIKQQCEEGEKVDWTSSLKGLKFIHKFIINLYRLRGTCNESITVLTGHKILNVLVSNHILVSSCFNFSTYLSYFYLLYAILKVNNLGYREESTFVTGLSAGIL